jgi:hypothetical protein
MNESHVAAGNGKREGDLKGGEAPETLVQASNLVDQVRGGVWWSERLNK